MTHSLSDAATYLGIPENELHQMVWAGIGPEQIGHSYWSPVFSKSALDAYLAQHPAKPHNAQPVVKPGVWAVKRMRQR